MRTLVETIMASLYLFAPVIDGDEQDLSDLD